MFTLDCATPTFPQKNGRQAMRLLAEDRSILI